MRNIDDALERLSHSSFRRRFALGAKDRAYLADKSLAVVMQHGRDFIAKRLAIANPPRDGKQTPFRGHPVFVAQHATATCCRGCLTKWHAIPQGRALQPAETEFVLALISAWLERTTEAHTADTTGCRNATIEHPTYDD